MSGLTENEKEEFTILTPNGMLGYGYDLSHFWHGIHEYKPSAIIVDSGSTDPGPYMLGTGSMLCSRESYIRDLTPILDACYNHQIKFLMSSAGGAGTNEHVDEIVNILREIAEAHIWTFKIATIYSEVGRDSVCKSFKSGGISPCSSAPPLLFDQIENTTKIVAQIGAEPFLEVLHDKPDTDIIVSGRSYDPAPFAAYSMFRGVNRDPAWHMGKILECGGLCAVPKGKCMVAIMRKDSFDLIPLSPLERCTPVSVAAHTLYEKTRPDRLPGPGGILHLDGAIYEQLIDQRTVRVHGSKFVPSTTYQVKLEGVELIGYRTIFIGGIRDPTLIAGLDQFLQTVQETTEASFPSLAKNKEHNQLIFHVYGRNAVMGSLEPIHAAMPHEVGILGEVLAPTQDEANAIGGFARTCVLHCAYEGQIATAGNFASPLTPLQSPIGPVYKFSVYHLMNVESPKRLFPTKFRSIGSEHQPNPLLNNISRRTDHRATNGYVPLQPVPLSSIVPKSVSPNAVQIKDIAAVVRSKNSGPFELTLDVLFDSRDHYERVKRSNVLNREVIRQLYQIDDADIIILMYFDPAYAWKCTLKRPWSQGSVGERDTFGTQQHAPLLNIVVP